MTYRSIPFGRHAGVRLDLVPLRYVLWLASQRLRDPDLRAMLLDEILDRLLRQREAEIEDGDFPN